jgi:hypothetical protein
MKLRPVQTMDNAQLDRLAIAADRQKPLRFKYRLLRNLSANPPARDWIIKNVIAAGETSAWIGPPGSLKSALLGELAFCVAAKQDWHGYKAKRSGLVVYFALERADLVRRRLLAYRARFDGDVEGIGPIAIVAGLIDLSKPATVRDVIASIRAAEEETGEAAAFVIWDTFAKLLAAGGGNENAATDQNNLFANLQRIVDEIGCHAALIGHTGKDIDRGARGSNAFDGHVDVMVTISGETVKTATVTKINDGPEGLLFSFKSEIHEFGHDADGDPITVNVVSSEEVSTQVEAKPGPKLKPNQQTVFAILHTAGSAGLTLEDWNAQAKDAGIGIKRKADLTDIRNALQGRGLVRNYGDRWYVCHK